MRTVLMMVLAVLLMASVASADVLSSSTSPVFQKDVDKAVRIEMPSNCSIMVGTLVLDNCSLISINEEFTNKIMNSNGNRSILYELNAEVMIGDNLVITVSVPNHTNASVQIIDANASTPDEQAITIDNFEVTLVSFFDLNADGLLNGDDVIIMKDRVLDGTAHSTDLQAIINAVIA